MNISETKKPPQYIIDEWVGTCLESFTALTSDCPLLEDEVLTEMYKYVNALELEVNALRKHVGNE